MFAGNRLERMIPRAAAPVLPSVLPSVLAAVLFATGGAADALAASCDASRLYTYDFTTAAAQQLSYASSYTFTATNGLGQSQSFTVSFQTFGTSSTIVNSQQMPRVGNLVNDGSPTTGNNLVIGMILAARTTNIAANTNVVVTNFAFATPIRDLAVQANDIDFTTNQFRDWLQVTGSNGATGYNPTLTTPFGQTSGGILSATSSSLQLGAATTPLTVAVNQAMGNGSSGNNANNGTLTATFPQPVTGVQLRYGNSNQSAGGTTTGQQAYGIQRVTWCAMPVLTVTKTSTPLDTTGNNRFNIPGADMVYTVTLANSGGSDLDLGTVSAVDAMPTATSFWNGPFSATVTTPFSISASGGASVATQAFAYSNDGTTYGYVPAAGYDAAVRAFRFTGTGTVPPGGAVSLSFRAQIR